MELLVVLDLILIVLLLADTSYGLWRLRRSLDPSYLKGKAPKVQIDQPVK